MPSPREMTNKNDSSARSSTKSAPKQDECTPTEEPQVARATVLTRDLVAVALTRSRTIQRACVDVLIELGVQPVRIVQPLSYADDCWPVQRDELGIGSAMLRREVHLDVNESLEVAFEAMIDCEDDHLLGVAAEALELCFPGAIDQLIRMTRNHRNDPRRMLQLLSAAFLRVSTRRYS